MVITVYPNQNLTFVNTAENHRFHTLMYSIMDFC